jgi:hypothetical protein
MSAKKYSARLKGTGRDSVLKCSNKNIDKQVSFLIDQ